MTLVTKKKLAKILMKHKELDNKLCGVNKMMGDNGMPR